MTGLSSMKIIAMAMVVILGVWHFIDKGIYLKPPFGAALMATKSGPGLSIHSPPAGSFSEDARHPFANTTTSPSSIALALYGVMWAYDGW